MNRLIIRLYEASVKDPDVVGLESIAELSTQCDWLLIDQQGEALANAEGFDIRQLLEFLQTQTLKFTDLVVLPPAHRLQIKRVSLAAGQQRHASQVLPFLMEEGFAQAADELHYTQISKATKEAVWVVVVDRKLLTHWLAQLAQWQFINPVLLPLQCVFLSWPQRNESAALLVSTNQLTDASVNGQQSWLWIDQDAVLMLADELLDRLPLSGPVEVYCELAEQAVLPPSPETALSSTIWENTNHAVLQVVASYVTQSKLWRDKDLCHGDFGQTGMWFNALKPWRWVLVASLLVFFLELLLTQQATQSLQQQQARIQQSAESLFLELVPSEGKVRNLTRQLAGRLKQASAESATDTLKLTPYEVLARIDLARAQVSGEHRLIKLDFADQTYRLEWQAEKRETFDGLREAMQSQSLPAQLEQIVRREQGYEAAIRIQLVN